MMMSRQFELTVADSFLARADEVIEWLLLARTGPDLEA